MPLGIGLLLSCLLIPRLFGKDTVDFDDAALLKGSTSVYAQVDDVPIHGKAVDTLDAVLAGSRDRQQDALLVWFGNSQLHAINQYVEGQETAPSILFRALANEGIDVVAFSQPNATLEEHYVLFESLRAQASIDTLILPVVFDDTRNTGLRAGISPALDDPAVVECLSQTGVGRDLLSKRDELAQDDGDYGGVKETTQERSERFLNTWLEAHSQIWALRSQARGKLFLKLYHLRNFVFHITPQTKRPRIASRYTANMAALQALLEAASRNGIHVIVYVVPIRDDVPIPYIEEEYEQFKADVESLAATYDAAYANLEAIVPAEYWGQKAATAGGVGLEMDFMHFTAEGHRLLADKVLELLRANGSPAPAPASGEAG